MEAIAEYSARTCVPNMCVHCRLGSKSLSGFPHLWNTQVDFYVHVTRLETIKVYSPASPDRTAHTPQTHTQRQRKEIWQLPQKKQNVLIHSSNIIYTVPEQHHKCQLTDPKKTAPRPAKIQNVSIKKGRVAGLNQNMKCMNQDVYRIEKCFTHTDCVIEITASSFLSGRKVVPSLSFLEHRRGNIRQNWSAQWSMPQLSLGSAL